MKNLHIRLQSASSDFDADFLKQLPALEQVMVEKGLDPSAFIIAKNSPQSNVPLFKGGDPYQYDYTIFVKGESFTVSRSGDADFLRYFTQLCLAPDENNTPLPMAEKMILAEHKLEAFVQKIARWLKEAP